MHVSCEDCRTKVKLTEEEGQEWFEGYLTVVRCPHCAHCSGKPERQYYEPPEYILLECMDCEEPVKVPAPTKDPLPIAVKCDRCLASGDFSKETIFNKTDGLCSYCGRKLSAFGFHREHVIPKSQGGPHIPENIVPSCRLCNIRKRGRDLEEFREWIHDGGSAWNDLVKGCKRVSEFHEWVKPMFSTDDQEELDAELLAIKRAITEYFGTIEQSAITFEIDKMDIELFLDGRRP